jgi:hypothetical protein
VELKKDGAFICTQERFEQNKRIDETPDLYIECDGQSCIIDAYNGTSEKEIEKKLNLYSSHFPQSRVYVFSSGVSALEQLTAEDKPTFSFHCITDKTLKRVSRIECGTVVLELSAICDEYFSEYRIFKSEIVYWLNCEQEGTIIQTNLDSKYIV